MLISECVYMALKWIAECITKNRYFWEFLFLQAKNIARAQKLYCRWNLCSTASSLDGLHAITVIFYYLTNIPQGSFGIKANFWTREYNKGERKRWKLKLKKRDVREEDKKLEERQKKLVE
jgi:hypothetical protein